MTQLFQKSGHSTGEAFKKWALKRKMKKKGGEEGKNKSSEFTWIQLKGNSTFTQNFTGRILLLFCYNFRPTINVRHMGV